MIIWTQKDLYEPTLTRVAEVDDTLAEALLENLKEVAAQPSGGRSRPVMIIAIDDEKFSEHEKPRGKANPVHVGQKFPSALALSVHLGYPPTNNAVKQMLSDDRRRQDMAAGPGHTQRLRPMGELRGVVFMLEDDVPESINIEWQEGRFERRAKMGDCD